MENLGIDKIVYGLNIGINNFIEDFIVQSVNTETREQNIEVNIAKIKDAIQKQIPKKPINTDNMLSRCPSCNSYVVQNLGFEKVDYCVRCGQAIDWTEEGDTDDSKRTNNV